jgi:uncharacterized cupin superfamily protein
VRKPGVVIKAAEIAGKQRSFQHPWNANAEISGARLGVRAGLERAAVNLFRVPAGKESFVPHAHRHEEEWLYILSGRAIVIMDNVEHEVGPGDFIGFPTPSVVHHLRNPFAEDVVYLCGGENLPFEVVDYPEHGRIGVRDSGLFTTVPADAPKPFPER